MYNWKEQVLQSQDKNLPELLTFTYKYKSQRHTLRTLRLKYKAQLVNTLQENNRRLF
jgi:hypothetical protein